MFGMALRDEIERAQLRRAMSRAAERSKMRRTGIYSPEEQRERPTTGRRVASMPWWQALREYEAECDFCAASMPLVSHTVDELRVTKLWYCERCNFTLRGAYRIYVIPEFPGRD